jgi:AAA ATPase-like protein
LLCPTNEPIQDDIRESSPDEDIVNESSVRFLFSLDREERLEIYEKIKDRVLSSDLQIPVVRDDVADMSLAQLCDRMTEGLYYVDVKNQVRGGRYWPFPSGRTLAAGWFTPTPQTPDIITVELGEGMSKPLKSFSLVHETATEEIDSQYLAAAKIEALETLMGVAVTGYVLEHLPECIFWRYNDEYLIPARLPLESFALKPDTCVPLQHAFSLAGISDIASAVAEAKRRQNGVRNLLDRVAKRATEHVRSVWPEYKGLALDLRQNGEHLETTVNDVYNLYNFSRRSDGFKRFISFLLMISAPTLTKSLSNVLILNDDPDAGLHPSGARHLRDELIRVSESNYVVYSTHSIFMIDRDVIPRHLIVRKQSEVTSIADADESNVVDEEVLYNALGFSVFEMLRQNNIVFEGWRDKILFRTAMLEIPATHSALKDKVAKLGMCHVEGVKDVRRVTPLLELADRGCIIVSDADKVAREHQRQHIQDRLYGDWVRYDELVTDFEPVTAEDFIEPEFVADCITEVANQQEKLPARTFHAHGGTGQLRELDKQLAKAGLSSDERKLFADQLKDVLYSRLKPTHVLPKYYEFVTALVKRIEREAAD